MSESVEIVEQATVWGPVVVVSDARVPLAWIRLAFPVGSYDELPGRHDPATLWRAAVTIALDDRPLSAEVEPWMTADACGVDALFLVADAQAVAEGLQGLVEADFANAHVPSRVLRSAWKQERAAPAVVLAAAVAEAFYHRDDPRHLAAARPSGAVTGELLRALRDAVLRAPGAVFGVAGALEGDDGAELVRDVLSTVEPPAPSGAPRSALRPLIPAERRPADVVLSGAGEGEVLLAWARPGVARTDPSVGAALVADAALRAGVERLAREERGDTYGVRTDGMVDREASAWTLVVTTAPDRVPGLVGAVEGWLDAVARDGLPPADLARGRAHIQSAITAARTGAPNEVLGRELALRLPGAQGPELLAAAREARDDAVQAFVRAFAERSGWTRLRVLPLDTPDPLAPR